MSMGNDADAISNVLTLEGLTVRFEGIPGKDNQLIVVLDGIIDTSNSIVFQNKICELIEKGYINLIFQCEKLNYMSSTGVGTCSVFLERVGRAHGKILFTKMNVKVLQTLDLLGLTSFFKIVDNQDEAIKMLGA